MVRTHGGGYGKAGIHTGAVAIDRRRMPPLAELGAGDAGVVHRRLLVVDLVQVRLIRVEETQSYDTHATLSHHTHRTHGYV
jgi:hypothetical protein